MCGGESEQPWRDCSSADVVRFCAACHGSQTMELSLPLPALYVSATQTHSEIEVELGPRVVEREGQAMHAV